MKNIKFDAELDYHDLGILNHFEIEKYLEDFLLDCHVKGHSRLLVVTGKGEVVRPMVLKLLKMNKLVKNFESREQVDPRYSGSFIVYI